MRRAAAGLVCVVCRVEPVSVVALTRAYESCACEPGVDVLL